MHEEMQKDRDEGFFDAGSMRDEVSGRNPMPFGKNKKQTLTATKSADPRAGTDREDLRRRLHRSQDTADPLHEKQTA